MDKYIIVGKRLDSTLPLRNGGGHLFKKHCEFLYKRRKKNPEGVGTWLEVVEDVLPPTSHSEMAAVASPKKLDSPNRVNL